jgi:hypothetical protein
MRNLKPTYFESIKQCAAMTSIPVHKLKQWKSEGAPCFRYSRIYHAELLDYIANKRGPGAEPTEPPASHWQREKAKVDYERAKFALELEQKKHVSLEEVTCAAGQMLVGLMSGLRMLPASAARWLVGLRDFHQIKAKLETELDSVLASLNRARYMEDVAPTVIEKLFSDRTAEFRNDLKTCFAQAFIELGREWFRELHVDLADTDARKGP